IRTEPRIGVSALGDVAGLDLTDCSTRGIVFSLGPRINAAGRLGDAARAVELLLASDRGMARSLAAVLEETNSRRRDLDRETAEDAVQMALETYGESPDAGIVLHNSEWHPGVIGIVASRLVERFARPTVMLTTVNGLAKGSARSIPGVNVFEALRRCAEDLEEFGGHDFAAGLSIRPGQIPAFAEHFNEAVLSLAEPGTFQRTIHYDASLELGSIDSRFWAVLRQFAPHGPTNEQPVFHGQSLRVLGRPRTVGRDNSHLKFVVRKADSTPMPVIGFGLGDRLQDLEACRRGGRDIDLLFSVDEQTWNGRRSLQLRARDLRVSGNGTETVLN
ncbi:MAG: DHHA1 domain-containing protein, partial [Rhodothermales bacterium]|nr:DHHA1 domain-containing protein [Rhodothermales bacterium]